MWSGGLGGGRLRLGGRVFKNYTVDYYGEATFFHCLLVLLLGLDIYFVFCTLWCDAMFDTTTLPFLFTFHLLRHFRYYIYISYRVLCFH